MVVTGHGVCSMKRSSDSPVTDVSCMSIMDKFGLSSPTRVAAGGGASHNASARYRMMTSPSHLHHLLRTHSNASSTSSAAAADGMLFSISHFLFTSLCET